jgi:hypothetical protein
LIGKSDDDGVDTAAFAFGKCCEHRRTLTTAPLFVVYGVNTWWNVGDVDCACDDDDRSDVGFDRSGESVVNNSFPPNSGEKFVALSGEPPAFSGREHGNEEMGSRRRSHV